MGIKNSINEILKSKPPFEDDDEHDYSSLYSKSKIDVAKMTSKELEHQWIHDSRKISELRNLLTETTKRENQIRYEKCQDRMDKVRVELNKRTRKSIKKFGLMIIILLATYFLLRQFLFE